MSFITASWASLYLIFERKKLCLRYQSVHKRRAISIAKITTFHIHVCSVTDRCQQGLPTDSHGTNTHFTWSASTPVLCHTMREKCVQFINYLSYLKMAYSKGNKTVPGKVATTHTEDGYKQDT